MFANINETGKIFGIPIFQPKAIQTEFENWIKEKHPHFGLAQIITALIATIGFAGWYLKLHPSSLLVVILPFLVYMIYIMMLSRQYNKQAPEGLRRR